MAVSPSYIPTPTAADHQYYDDDNTFLLQSFPLSHINKTHLLNGNRIIMPSSAIHSVIPRRKSRSPMTFEITNLESSKSSHCGVLEFSAEDGCVFIPDWMMHALCLKIGQLVKIEKTGNLAPATYMKIQPRSIDFVQNLSDPEVVLEGIFKDFVCATAGETIMVNHQDKSYYINIIATDPEDVVSLFDVDCELVVMQALDYKEPPEQIKTDEGVSEEQGILEEDFAKFKPFTGVSRQLDEKTSANTTSAVVKTDSNNFDKMTSSDAGPAPEDMNCVGHKNQVKKFEPFTGRKYTLSGS